MSKFKIYINDFAGVGNTYDAHLPNLKISWYVRMKTNWKRAS